MILSIIIPVYNVEKYIEKCLLSCLNQDIPSEDYEIIVVNDGSPDNSDKIIQNIKKSYSNILVFNQKNKGLSEARNTGFKNSRGKYVWFIDSDDWIEKNCLGRIYNLLKINPDILQLQYRYVYEDTWLEKEIPIYRIKGIKSGPEVIRQGGLPAPAPFSIYRSQFLKDHDLAFVPGIYHEDSEFKPRVTYLAKRIISDTVVCYNYLQRTSGSITSNFRLKNGLDIIFVMNSLSRFTDNQKIPFKYRPSFYRKIGLNMNTLLAGLSRLNEKDKRILIDKLNMNKYLFRHMIFSDRLKYQVEGTLFLINLKFGLKLYHLLK